MEVMFEALHQHPFQLRLLGKSLLYKIEMDGEVTSLPGRLLFNMRGSVRFGPMKSEGRMESEYHKNNRGFAFLRHQMSFPGIRFSEVYTADDQELFFQKTSGPVKPVTLLDEKIFDPLPFVFCLLETEEKQQVRHSGHLLLGGRQKPYQYQQDQNNFQVEVSGRTLFSGQKKQKSALIDIPQFRVQLSLNRL